MHLSQTTPGVPNSLVITHGLSRQDLRFIHIFPGAQVRRDVDDILLQGNSFDILVTDIRVQQLFVLSEFWWQYSFTNSTSKLRPTGTPITDLRDSFT